MADEEGDHICQKVEEYSVIFHNYNQVGLYFSGIPDRDRISNVDILSHG
jgi:hypothetical protein